MNGSPLARIVEVAEDGRHLAKERGFLTIATKGVELARVPLDDLGAVMTTAPSTTASCALLAELATRGIPFVLCGRNYSPAALIWPLSGHHAQQRRMECQLGASRALGKRLWSQIVTAKIRRQGWALHRAERPSGAFVRLARQVRSGDLDNIEAQAARRYWRLLFGLDLRRNPKDAGVNALLNYGYTVLRGATARAIVAAGLHPGLGIFHRHPQNAMPLADDLMEPFRPVVDLAVIELRGAGVVDVTQDAKRKLAGVLLHEETTPAGRTPLSTCLIRLAGSLAESFLTGQPALQFPVVRLPRTEEAEDDAADR